MWPRWLWWRLDYELHNPPVLGSIVLALYLALVTWRIKRSARRGRTILNLVLFTSIVILFVMWAHDPSPK